MSETEGKKFMFNLPAIKRRMESRNDRYYTWEEIANGAEVHPNTLTGMVQNKSKMIRLDTLKGLIGYFHGQGVDVSVSDILVLVDEADGKPQ